MVDDTDREGEIETPVAVGQGGSIVYVIGHGQAATRATSMLSADTSTPESLPKRGASNS